MELFTSRDIGFTINSLFSPYKAKKEISHEDCIAALSYNVEKEVDHRPNGEMIRGHFHLIRTDKDIVIGRNGVGNRFTVQQPISLVDMVTKDILPHYKSAYVDTVGTLEMGATAFIEITTDSFRVEGDPSLYTNRVIVYDPMTEGSVRIVANVVREADNMVIGGCYHGRETVNYKASKVSHTASISDRTKRTVSNFSQALSEVGTLRTMINDLNSVNLTVKQVEGMLETIYPIPEKGSSKLITQRRNARQKVLVEFQKHPKGTAWTLIRAYSDMLASETTKKGCDEMYGIWDNLVGNRMAKKVKFVENVLELL